jgi:acyl-coenzyme A synthetase/AMP-(fatty) acid ligase/acyl carrier protein
MYGPTETTVWSTLDRVRATDAAPTVGHPIANTQLYVLDARRQLLPRGAVGELYIGGDGVAAGYLNRPDLTAERFVPSPFVPGALLYRTGDLARWRADGRLECLGRTDHQVKVRGHRIELGEIEAALAQHPAVRQAVVVAREDEDGAGRRLVAYTVGDPVPDEELRRHVRGRLPEYMVPSYFVALAAFPTTPNGKIDRKALPAPAVAGSAARTAGAAPRTDAERRMAAIWAEVLGIDGVGVDDDFFALGGTSVLLVQARALIADELGVELPLEAFFGQPTIAALSDHLETALKGRARR